MRQLLSKDFLEGLERLDKSLPSKGWLGSLLSATFLTSNSVSSSRVGCGAVELMHPVGGTVFRYTKCRSLVRVIEGRVGVSNFVRVIRAAVIASMLEDKGASEVSLSSEKNSGNKPLFISCVDEMVKRGGLASGTFVRALRVLSGQIREPYLIGTPVDASPGAKEQLKLPSQPEGFPNSFVRGHSGLYLQVGVHIEPVYANDQAKVNQLQAHIFAEPAIPEGGIAFGGPVTLSIIEKGQQKQNELVKTIESDGSRSDWGPITLYGEPVTNAKDQILRNDGNAYAKLLYNHTHTHTHTSIRTHKYENTKLHKHNNTITQNYKHTNRQK